MNRNHVRLALLLALALLAVAAPAHADTDAAEILGRANSAATAGDWAEVSRALQPLGRPGTELADSDRAELYRLSGLVAFFEHRLEDADSAWLAYLRLDLDGRLDPSTVPPEAIAFFEDVRARHGAELRALRPKVAPARRSWVLNLLPPVGQIQNREPVRAWLFGGALVALIGANLGSYAILRSWCSESDATCDGHRSGARTLRVVNLVSGVGAIATYILGVVDGFRGQRRRMAVQVTSGSQGGAIFGLAGDF